MELYEAFKVQPDKAPLKKDIKATIDRMQTATLTQKENVMLLILEHYRNEGHEIEDGMTMPYEISYEENNTNIDFEKLSNKLQQMICKYVKSI